MTKEILKVSNLTKVYPGGVVANYNVNIAINKGEIHALIGENGASAFYVGAFFKCSENLILGHETSKAGLINKRQKMGIYHVSEDKLHFGSAPNLSIEDNEISKIYASK